MPAISTPTAAARRGAPIIWYQPSIDTYAADDLKWIRAAESPDISGFLSAAEFKGRIQLSPQKINDVVYRGTFSNCQELQDIMQQLRTLPRFVRKLALIHTNIGFIEHLLHGVQHQLTHVILTNNHLAHFPGFTYHCMNLRYLDLSHNFLHQLPVLSQLVKLETLIVSHNRISSLDNIVPTSPSNLHTLLTSNNCLEHLPDQLFESCPKLKVLDISKNNCLQTLPGGITELQSLKVDDCHALQMPPYVVAKNGLAHIRKYFRNQKKWLAKVK